MVEAGCRGLGATAVGEACWPADSVVADLAAAVLEVEASVAADSGAEVRRVPWQGLTTMVEGTIV